jgi:hypothetical protein
MKLDALCPAWCVTGADHLDEMLALTARTCVAATPSSSRPMTRPPVGVEAVVDVRPDQLVIRDGEIRRR